MLCTTSALLQVEQIFSFKIGNTNCNFSQLWIVFFQTLMELERKGERVEYESVTFFVKSLLMALRNPVEISESIVYNSKSFTISCQVPRYFLSSQS